MIVVDDVVDDHGTREIATAYLKYLYTKEGQKIAGKHHYRPRDPQVAVQYQDQFKKIPLVTIQDFGGWDKAQAKHRSTLTSRAGPSASRRTQGFVVGRALCALNAKVRKDLRR